MARGDKVRFSKEHPHKLDDYARSGFIVAHRKASVLGDMNSQRTIRRSGRESGYEAVWGDEWNLGHVVDGEAEGT